MLLNNIKTTTCLLLILVSTADGSWWSRRRRRSPPPDTTPPTFTNCKRWTTFEYIEDTSTTLRWTEPTAIDDRSGSVPVSRSGPRPGSTFTEGEHSVIYTATDSAGNTATCTLRFDITAIRCPSIEASPHLSFTCSNGNIASSTCTFSCTTGYYVRGPLTATCVQNMPDPPPHFGHWSPYVPTCRIRVCSAPPTPRYGSKSCPSYNYGATCTFRCNSGYALSGSSSRACDGSSWSGRVPSCRDIRAPTFSSCPGNIIVTNNDRVTSAVVRYATPAALDNSGSAPSISRISGQSSGTRFSSGRHTVRYRATDGSGNHAYCSFSVTVRVVSCTIISYQDGRVPSCPHGTLKGATCTFSCRVGFTMSGVTTTSCDANGHWNRGFPNCNGITCPQLSAPSAGSISSCSRGRSFASTCTFTCNTGYELIGSSSRHCSHTAGQSAGFWTGSHPRCQIKTCPVPSVSGGLRPVTRSTCQISSQNTVNYGSVCEYTCETGYRMIGNYLRTCGSSGSWSQPLPVCHVITCSLNSLPVPTNGVRTGCTGSSVSFGDSCFLSCNRGYRPTTSAQRTCRDNGSGQGVWSGGEITCSIVECSPLAAPQNGRITGCRRGGSHLPVTSRQAFDTSCTINCNGGYTLTSGPASRTCLTSGQWDGVNTFCTDITAPNLQCPADVIVYAAPGQITGSLRWNWEPLRASDASGSYTASLSEIDDLPVSSKPVSFAEGSHTLTYSVRDSSENRASCSFDVSIQVVRCRPLETPSHATIFGEACLTTRSAIRGTICQLSCDTGYERTSGNQLRTCTQDSNNPSQGYWSGSQLQCTAVRCTLPSLPHGFINNCRGTFITYQERCEFVCYTGYKTPVGESPRIRSCQADGTLSGPSFECSVQVTCPSLQVPSHGIVQAGACSSTTSSFGTTCRFTCDSGYALRGTSRVECLSSGFWSADTASTSCADIENPTFEDSCPRNIKRTAQRGQTTWTGQIEPPTAKDNSRNVVVERQRDSASSVTSTYSEGETIIVFEAVDLSGNTALCTYNLLVEVKRCTNLENPDHGFVESCTNHHGSTCRISCNDGYELTSVLTERTCELDDNQKPYWSGSDNFCTIRRCLQVIPPENALPSSCGGTPGNLDTFGSVCSFYCPYGFNPRGQNTVECLADGTWSKTSFTCEAVTCPSLASLGVTVTPSDCNGVPKYGQQCIFSCPPGFTISPISSVQVSCLGNGEWSSSTDDILCIDTSPPTFVSCPRSDEMTFYTDPATSTAPVNWSVSASDNGRALPTITCDPERGSSLEAKDYYVTCVARDNAENERQCVFKIKVKDHTCPPLSPPVNGLFTGLCSNIEGETCTVTCHHGYRLVGSPVAKCQTVNGETKWVRNSSPRCEAITCNPLPSFHHRGRIHPFFCHSPSRPFYGSVCEIGCTDRYSLVTDPSDVPSAVECLVDGSWTYDLEESYSCLDEVIPEVIYCPGLIQVSRDNILQPVTVHFDLPRAVDNSNGEIEPVLSPSVTPPLDVSQSTTILCLFQDSAGNQNDQCQIEIRVIDNVPPIVVRPCPDDQHVTARSRQTEVFWTEPLFEDPGGKHVIVFSNYEPGTKFSVGSFAVEYTARSEITGRQTECQFNVHVTLESCPPLEAPANGALACHETSEGQVCVMSCLPGFRRPPRQPTSFFCGVQGRWEPSRVVDCGVQRRPPRSRIPVKALYDTSDCSKAGQAPLIASSFLDQLLMTQFSDVCSGTNGCSVDDIKVTCGPVNSRNSRGRGRRQVEGFENLFWIFEIEIGVTVDEDMEISDSDAVQNANTTLQSLANEVGNFVPPTVEFPETVGGSTTFIPDSVQIDKVLLNCAEGFSPNILYSECVACVAGTFYSEEDEDCLPCPVGSYQDENQQTVCKACPEGTSTYREGAKRFGECHDLCPPGTFSRDGLFSCEKCDIGFYQPASGQPTCLNCPAGQKTSYLGATSRTDCKGPCAAGTSSQSGLEPCIPCPQRYYQPNTGQRFCLICDGRNTTERVGSISQSQCIDVNHCYSEPCQNNGSCKSLLQGYVCWCPPGFKGQDCEINEDECLGQPCRNGGTCEDGINSFQCFCPEGFDGPDCSIDIDDCVPEPCNNGGTCQDSLNTFLCHCPPNFEGPRCENEKDPCRGDPCINGGTCVKSGWDYDCICPTVFAGKNCSTQLSSCYENSCINGYCAEVEDGSYRCLCYGGFTGEYCDITIDFCADVDCKNGGTCTQTEEGAFCMCPPQFAGYYETCAPLDSCFFTPCANGGVCYLNDNLTSECLCAAGYSGDSCEVEINECASSPCLNSGLCEDKVNSYECVCMSSFIGKNCETNGTESDLENLVEQGTEIGSGSGLGIFGEDLLEDGSGSGVGITEEHHTELGSGRGLGIFGEDLLEDGSGSGVGIPEEHHTELGSGSGLGIFGEDLLEDGSGSGVGIPEEHHTELGSGSGLGIFGEDLLEDGSGSGVGIPEEHHTELGSGRGLGIFGEDLLEDGSGSGVGIPEEHHTELGSGSGLGIFGEDLLEDGSGSGVGIPEEHHTELGSGSGLGIFGEDLLEDGSGSGVGIPEEHHTELGSGSGLGIFGEDLLEDGSGSGFGIPEEHHTELGSGRGIEIFGDYFIEDGSDSGPEIAEDNIQEIDSVSDLKTEYV